MPRRIGLTHPSSIPHAQAQTMGTLLDIVAHGNPTTAKSGNRNPAQILVSVTDASGTPVNGLTSSDITFDTLLVGPGGANVVLDTFGTATFGGYYRLDVVPLGTLKWVSGEFDIAVMVSDPGTGNLAQTITSFIVP
jgi:hypothetical protein